MLGFGKKHIRAELPAKRVAAEPNVLMIDWAAA